MSHMDPPPTSDSMTGLQKTSPSTDPATASATDASSAEAATVQQLTTELSAQASKLLAHEQQLDRLTDLTAQLVRALQSFQSAAPPASPPPSAQPVTSGPRLAFPEKFDGTATKCKGFLLQCSLFVNQQPHLYPTDECKISFEFKKVFLPCTESGDAGEQIMALRQGRRTAADYALSFRTLAAQSGWNDGPLKLHYRKGLHPDLPAVNSWFQRSEETWDRAHVHLQGAIRRYQEQADRRRRPSPAYEPGQWVWLSTWDLRLRLPCKKLSPRYVGPFKIIKQITPVSYRLELPAEYRISPTFHVSLFKPADDPAGVENLEGTASQGPAPIVVDGEEVYRVNTILDSRRRRGQLQYLVDWEGFGPEERSWVASGDILDPSLTTDFHTQHPDRPAPRGRGRPRRRVPPRARSRSQGEGSVTTASPSAGAIPGLLTTFPISPCLGPVLPVPGRSEHFLRRPFIDPFRGRFPAKFWLEFLTILSVFPLPYCLPVADRTVYSLTILAACPLTLCLDYRFCTGLSALFPIVGD
ncbi:hypothetical protein H4Q32_025186 [Labeo rohita]|uniref:Chromo domain-containing protein n=1 Tax=Labeo rohita TaxID=84645 RepID=A0ABQ8L654_LABRO|nr:hypothetical protein H4Q32_025186 [Labeo rohita]